MDVSCEVCGNEIPVTMLVCKYCGEKQFDNKRYNSSGSIHRVINIERGKPVVEDALLKLQRELTRARQEKIRVVTVIHGYGSSGRGGAIRLECRKSLDYLASKREIRGFIPGENFSKKKGQTSALLRRVPQLANDQNLNKGNKGVTIVEL